MSEIHINDEDIGTPVLYLDDETGLTLADDEDRLRVRIDETLGSS